MSRALIATSPSSLAEARSGDLIVTESWKVFDEAERRGLTVSTLRDVIDDTLTPVLDRAVASWADILWGVEHPAVAGTSVARVLRHDLLWRPLYPLARHAFAARALGGEHSAIAVDLPAGTPIGDAVAAGTEAAGARVEHLRGGTEPALPESQRPVVHDRPGQLTRYQVLRALSPLLRATGSVAGSVAGSATGAGGRRSQRPLIALGYYPSLTPVVDALGGDAKFALWPWALPPPKSAVRMIMNGGRCMRPDAPPALEVLHSAERELAAAIEAEEFVADGMELTAMVGKHMSRQASADLGLAMHRTAAATAGLAALRPAAVLVPFDIGHSMAPLVAAAVATGIPSVLVQHGIEGSVMAGDKRTAGNLLVWSEAAGALYEGLPGSTPDRRIHITGPVALEGVAAAGRLRPAGRSRVLLLSYTSRHNTSEDSWLAAEGYVRDLASALPDLPPGVEITGLKLHPCESGEHYRRVMARYGLEVPLIDTGLAGEIIPSCDLVAGPESTALAEAWAAGRAVVCVNLSARPMAPPFDGETEIPVVGSAAGLVAFVSRWHAGDWSPSAEMPKMAAFTGDAEGAARRCAQTVLEIAVQ